MGLKQNLRKAFNDRKNYRKLRHKGLTMMELIVVLCIMALLSGIGSVAFLKYLKVGKLTALHQIGVHVLSRMQICTEESVLNTGAENLLPVDRNSDGDTTDPVDWKGCNSKARLNLADCEECAEPLVGDGIICITMTDGNSSQCVGYNPTGDLSHRFRITVSKKVCVNLGLTATPCVTDSDCGAGENCVTASGIRVCEKPSNRSAVWPYMECDSDANCDSGFKCFQGQGQCQTIGTTVNCS